MFSIVQVMVVPVGPPFNDYATEVAAAIRYYLFGQFSSLRYDLAMR
jgi:hypothetical protein